MKWNEPRQEDADSTPMRKEGDSSTGTLGERGACLVQAAEWVREGNKQAEKAAGGLKAPGLGSPGHCLWVQMVGWDIFNVHTEEEVEELKTDSYCRTAQVRAVFTESKRRVEQSKGWNRGGACSRPR